MQIQDSILNLHKMNQGHETGEGGFPAENVQFLLNIPADYVQKSCLMV